MSTHDQCHSTLPGHEHPKPRHKPRVDHDAVGVSPTGRKYWRSLDDLADTPQFREWLEREFPAGASELLGDSRRTFLKLMAASLALAGAATIPGCRRPDQKILPYSKNVPEDTIPGRSLYYATSMPLPGGGAEGLLVETHEGRPTKIEGNPLHPINRGKSSVWAQASVLGLYDPDRLKDPVLTEHGETARSWEDVAAESAKLFAAHDATKGEDLAFIVEKVSSPTRDAVRDTVMKRWPKARWVSYDPVQADSPVEGATAAFGRPMREVLKFDQANVVVSLDRDFTCGEASALVHARDWASTRRPMGVKDSMSRLYVAESGFSGVGGKADHRWRLAPSQVSAFAVAVAKAVLDRVQSSGAAATAIRGIEAAAPAGVDAKHIDAIADDLADKANLGRSIIVAGGTQPAAVHAIVHTLNAALGNVGSTVLYTPLDAEEARSSAKDLAALCEAMKSGAIKTVVVSGVNPAYDAPADCGFEEAFKKVKNRIVHSVDTNETVAMGTWRLPSAHYLESWGDTRAADGTIAPIQPMIAPLYGDGGANDPRSGVELLAMFAGDKDQKGYDLVRRTWQAMPAVKAMAESAAAFEKVWRRALHDGVLTGQVVAAQRPTIAADSVAAIVKGFKPAAAPTAQSLEAVFTVGNIGDGRYANAAWLQELPDPATKMVWDNAALLSPATAEALGVKPSPETDKKPSAAMATLTIGARSITIPVWTLPGMADNTVLLPLGYGRKECGVVGRDVGVSVYPVRDGAARATVAGAKLAATGGARYEISTTQTHGSMEGRALVREVDLAAWNKHGEEIEKLPDAYGRMKELNFGERLGELAHAPANVSLYTNPMNASKDDPPKDPTVRNEQGKVPPYTQGPQWGMSIDLSTCTGCGVCTVACQSENNIPVVGKIEVNKGREMHWIRVDRYFAGDDAHGVDSMMYQPVACVHCENAPCETVCPVNATVHGTEGINYMVYNRCIGTRYCANNCPYKVRRFNFFAWGVQKYNGKYIGEESMPRGGPANKNLIPPQLREKLDEITRLGMNPNVTIRSRGVMEKCTYCLQRINEARVEAKVSDLKFIPDGMVQAACQQACPTGAIVFGDILDTQSNSGKGSAVRQMRNHGRSYMLLGFLNTRPRTTYMAGVRNPNPKIRTPVADPFHDEHHDHDHDHGHDHGAEQPKGEHALRDPGLKFSLPVLGVGV